MLQAHFRNHHLKNITYPTAFGVRIGNVAIYPAKVYRVTLGQVYRKKLSGQDTTTMLLTSTVRPNKHISDIKRAVNHASVGFFNACVEALVTLTAALNQDLAYRSSPYMMNAEMAVNTVPMQAPDA